MSDPRPSVEVLFAAALEISDLAARRVCLDRECAGNQARRAEVESLLRAYDQAGEFLGESLLIRPDSVLGHACTPQRPAESAANKPGTAGIKVRYVGDYELLEEIGSGGMGIIYKAR